MGEVYPGLPVDLARSIIDQLGFSGAVETGTYMGDSARIMREMVPEVWTVEASDEIWEAASANLADLTGVHLLRGKSETVLEKLVPELKSPVLYWLDEIGRAHV